jgi:hypothetical protein
MMGELKKLQRMVQRRDFKTQIKLLKQIINTHQPLVKAMSITAKAYHDGKQAGAQEMLVKLEAAEQERLLKEAQTGATNVPSDDISRSPFVISNAVDSVLQQEPVAAEATVPEVGNVSTTPQGQSELQPLVQ